MAEIELRHVDKHFGALHVIRDVNLTVADREFVVFLGPSGCGKTTTLRAIAGLEDIDSGDILIDPGSDRSVDNSYTDAADIYVGDVSSQVYEFLARPRPCVFLNAAGIDWRDDRHFLFWHLGDVVDDPADLMAAIRAAPSRHHLYIDRQRELAAQSLGDTSPGAAARAASLILDYLVKGRVPL